MAAQYIDTMETTIYVKTDFACVYLLNGTFVESADGFSYPAREPLYITVLPLSAHLLPYTVKIAGNKPLANEKLCAVFTEGDKLFVKLLPRYNYIYSVDREETLIGQTVAERLFYAVKQKNFSDARKFLSDGLSGSVDDVGLTAFFADYTQILKDDFSSTKIPNSYYLINREGKGELFIFETKDGLVDDITGKE